MSYYIRKPNINRLLFLFKMYTTTQADNQVLQFIYTDPESFTNYIQKLQDFAISHMSDCDQELIYDVIPAVNQFLVLLRAQSKAGTLFISE